MKVLLNIIAVFLVLAVAFPQEAIAADACCSTQTTCHTEDQKEDHAPCDSDCHCTCCFSISVYSNVSKALKKESEEKIADFVFYYDSLSDSFFISSIWQPPRLG